MSVPNRHSFPDFDGDRTHCASPKGEACVRSCDCVLADFGFQGFDDAVIFEFPYGVHHGDDKQGEEYCESQQVHRKVQRKLYGGRG